MTNPMPSILKDATYIRLANSLLRKMYFRRVRAELLAHKIFKKSFLPDKDCAFITGSHSRMKSTYGSDIDILVATNRKIKNWPSYNLMIDKKIEDSRVSLRFIHCEEMWPDFGELSLLFTLNNLVPIYGNCQVHKSILCRFNQILDSLSIQNLVSFWKKEFDSDNFINRSSHYYYDVKRGMPGLFEMQYIELLLEWHYLKASPEAKKVSQALSLLRIYENYSLLIKERYEKKCNEAINSLKLFLEGKVILMESDSEWFLANDIAIRSLCFRKIFFERFLNEIENSSM